MYKFSKRIISMLTVCSMVIAMFSLPGFTVSAVLSDIECSEELEVLAVLDVSNEGVSVIASSTPSYPYLNEGILQPGSGSRTVQVSVPSGKKARQYGFVGGLNGGVPAGATGVLTYKGNQYMFQYGQFIVRNITPATGTLTFYITPNAPYNGSSYTYHYAVILYGN